MAPSTAWIANRRLASGARESLPSEDGDVEKSQPRTAWIIGSCSAHTAAAEAPAASDRRRPLVTVAGGRSGRAEILARCPWLANETSDGSAFTSLLMKLE